MAEPPTPICVELPPLPPRPAAPAAPALLDPDLPLSPLGSFEISPQPKLIAVQQTVLQSSDVLARRASRDLRIFIGQATS
jgi:hypothetical protein